MVDRYAVMLLYRQVLVEFVVCQVLAKVYEKLLRPLPELERREFNEHLSIQQHYGIPVDHRRRPDGSSVIMMRHSQFGMYTPEKTATVSVRSSSCESVVVGCVSGSAEPSPVECAPPPVVRPIDPQGVVGAAIPPETLLCSEEQEVIRRFR